MRMDVHSIYLDMCNNDMGSVPFWVAPSFLQKCTVQDSMNALNCNIRDGMRP